MNFASYQEYEAILLHTHEYLHFWIFLEMDWCPAQLSSNAAVMNYSNTRPLKSFWKFDCKNRLIFECFQKTENPEEFAFDFVRLPEFSIYF